MQILVNVAEIKKSIYTQEKQKNNDLFVENVIAEGHTLLELTREFNEVTTCKIIV